ncbi:MAG: outer membrane lipoprotein carrier protein LolA [Deltaproteobacteria bacterium]|nr:outer membrane lipoprotein carrier protein LolA [Deltaproteobacteria bacterium]
MLIGLLASTAAWADPWDDDVEAIQLTYHNLTDWRARFTQSTRVEGLGKTITATGELTVKKPGKLRLEYHTNPPRRYISDGKMLWIYSEGDNQYQVLPLGSGAVPRDALTFLTGFGDLRRTFLIEPAVGDTRPAGYAALRLRPKRKAGYRSLDVVFDARHRLVQLVIVNPSGNRTHYRFDGVEMNTGIADTRFRFTPPAGTHPVKISGS